MLLTNARLKLSIKWCLKDDHATKIRLQKRIEWNTNLERLFLSITTIYVFYFLCVNHYSTEFFKSFFIPWIYVCAKGLWLGCKFHINVIGGLALLLDTGGSNLFEPISTVLKYNELSIHSCASCFNRSCLRISCQYFVWLGVCLLR